MTTRSATTSPPTTMSTASDALHDEEVTRTRTFLRLSWIVAAGVIVSVPLLPGDHDLGLALIGMLGITTLATIVVYLRLRRPTPVDRRLIDVLAFAATLCGMLGLLYAGHMSATPALIALGLFVFCRTEHLASAVGVLVLAAGGHAVLGALMIGGVVDDPGFYTTPADASTIAQIVALFTIEQMYLLCFFLARLTRRSSLRAIDQLQRATRLAAVRDAQVAELRQDLDRALKIGGPGRFTTHVVGSYELGNVLGRGAMGEVYAGRHVRTGQEAAVKLLRREMLSDSHHVERFFREVRIASSMESPHVVRVLEASSPTDPLPYLAMELLRGETLGEALRRGPVTGAKLAAMVQQIGGVLDLARDVGVVHRDLKPHNLFVTTEGLWKVLDFGVALLADSTGTLTQGAVIGTPAYMAPEQARGEPVDHRADVYGLGAVIYRCLTARVPFVARDTAAVLYAVVHTMPLRPSAFGPISAQLESFLAVAMAKSRDARFATAGELARCYAEADRGALAPSWQYRAKALLQQRPWVEPELPGASRKPAA